MLTGTYWCFILMSNNSILNMLSLSISFQFYHRVKKELNECFIFNFNFLFFLFKKKINFLFYLTCLLIYVDVGPLLVFPTQVNTSWQNIKGDIIPYIYIYIYIYIKPFGFVVILGECCGRSRLIGECSNNLAASHIEKRRIPKINKKP